MTWLIARRLGMYQGVPMLPNVGVDDSLEHLENFGFTDVKVHDNHFYEAVPPTGWTKKENGRWTTYYDEQGRERFDQLNMLDVGPEHDRDVMISIEFPNPW